MYKVKIKMLLVPKLWGMVACLFSSIEPQSQMKSYFAGNENLEACNHQVQANIALCAKQFHMGSSCTEVQKI